MFDYTSNSSTLLQSIIHIPNDYCTIKNLYLDGNQSNLSSSLNVGINLFSGGSNNTIRGNTCDNNNSSGMLLGSSSSNNTITGNICNNNKYGINLFDSRNNTTTGNTCNNNNTGINLSSSSNNTITGNTCMRGTGLSSDYTSTQYTIYLNGFNNSGNLISSNLIRGKNYLSGGGASNVFVNNEYSETHASAS